MVYTMKELLDWMKFLKWSLSILKMIERMEPGLSMEKNVL